MFAFDKIKRIDAIHRLDNKYVHLVDGKGLLDN